MKMTRKKVWCNAMQRPKRPSCRATTQIQTEEAKKITKSFEGKKKRPSLHELHGHVVILYFLLWIIFPGTKNSRPSRKPTTSGMIFAS